MLILEVVLGCPTFLLSAIWGRSLGKNKGNELSVQQKKGTGRNTVSRVLFRRRELTEFYGKLGEFGEKLGEFALAHK